MIKRSLLKAMGVMAVNILMLCTAGCWDSHELDTLAIVTGVGLDAAQQPGEINFIAQVGKVAQITSKEGKSSGENSFQLLKVTSKSILDAIDSLNRKSSRLLFLPHNEVIIFGKDQAQKGIKPYIDYFVRDDETRMDMHIFVADGKTEDILSVRPEQEQITAVAMTRMMENETHKSQALNVSLLNFTSRLIDKSISAIAPVVKTIEENGAKKLSLSGMAVFKEDRLVGELGKDQIEGYIWAMGKIRGGILDVSIDAGSATLNIVDTACKSDVILQNDGSIVVSLKISGKLTVGELQDFEDSKLTEVFPLLEQAAAKKVQKQVEDCFKATQKLNADIYGYGSAIRRKYPDAWKTMESRWNQLYPAVTLSLEIKVTLTGTGKISDSLNMEENQP